MLTESQIQAMMEQTANAWASRPDEMAKQLLPIMQAMAGSQAPPSPHPSSSPSPMGFWQWLQTWFKRITAAGSEVFARLIAAGRTLLTTCAHYADELITAGLAGFSLGSLAYYAGPAGSAVACGLLGVQLTLAAMILLPLWRLLEVAPTTTT